MMRLIYMLKQLLKDAYENLQSYFSCWIEILFFFLSLLNLTQVTLANPLLWEECTLSRSPAPLSPLWEVFPGRVEEFYF